MVKLNENHNNNTLNIIELLFLLFFSSFKNIELENLEISSTRKVDFLSSEKISDRSHFVNKKLIQ